MRGRQREREKFSVCTQSDENHVYGAHLLLLLRPQLKHTHTHAHTRTHVRGCRRTHAHPRIGFNTLTKKSWEPPPIHWFDLSIKQAQTHTRTHTHAQKHQKKKTYTHKKKHNRPVCWHVVWITPWTPCLARERVCVCVFVCVCANACVLAGAGEACLATIRDNSTQITTLITTILKSHLWLS